MHTIGERTLSIRWYGFLALLFIRVRTKHVRAFNQYIVKIRFHIHKVERDTHRSMTRMHIKVLVD